MDTARKHSQTGGEIVMNNGYIRTITGQVLLVICCIFYILWWRISYRPGTEVNRMGGLNGVLLLITALSGVSGLFLSVYGENTLPALNNPKLNGFYTVICGIAVYVILIFITQTAFHRPVTTELFLITGWLILEMTVISALNAAEKLSDFRFRLIFCIITAAFIISIVLYILYYKMKPMKAFYAAMVPLITEGITMLVLVLLTF